MIWTVGDIRLALAIGIACLYALYQLVISALRSWLVYFYAHLGASFALAGMAATGDKRHLHARH